MDLSCPLSEELGLETEFGLKTSAFVQTLVAKPHGTVRRDRKQQLLTQSKLILWGFLRFVKT